MSWNFKIDFKFKKSDISKPSVISEKLDSLKNNDLDYLKTEKDLEYERNIFLHSIGFVNLSRVKTFIGTMKKIGNIEAYLEIKNKFKSYNLEILNSEMLSIILKECNLKKEKDKNFNGYFPNSAIDTLKINYTKIKDYLKYTLYYRYYTGESYELYDKKDDYLCNNITRLLNNADSYYDNSYYYKIERKNLFVCHNKECGFIILELETDFYMILSEWNINGIDILEKMNFKEFIENSK